ncbi:MAG: AmmeMemoRadiSam system protein A [Desulfobacterales bacterium]|jgi:AmmeMemoRadiSam system protein A
MENKHTGERALSEAEGRLLLQLARQTIAAELNIEDNPPPDFEAQMHASVFATRRGTFVTLKKSGDLRGCIGSLTTHQSLSDNVRTNARNAAFRDPRFSPLAREEFDQVQIEVSVLSNPQKLDYTSAQELCDRLQPHVDGLVIRKGSASATFLPQVWKQLERPEDFLAHLCLKAGLKADAWRRADLEVETYRVQYFDE